MRRGMQPAGAEQRGAESVVGQVALGGLAGRLQTLDLGQRRGQRRAVGQQQRSAELRQGERGGAADAVGGTGHQDAPAAHVQRGG